MDPNQIYPTFWINILQDLQGQSSHFQVLMRCLKRARESASRVSMGTCCQSWLALSHGVASSLYFQCFLLFVLNFQLFIFFQLIFGGEYIRSDDNAYHLEHFVCSHCERGLSGEQHLVDQGLPICVTCYDEKFASTCHMCGKAIGQFWFYIIYRWSINEQLVPRIS